MVKLFFTDTYYLLNFLWDGFSMMDVLVTWKDGTQNVVHTRELFPIRKGQKITLGTKVKMLYERKWWYGTVTVVEAKEYSSSEDEPLSTYVPANRVQNCCEYINCHNPILTTCTECACFLCAEHYQEDASCSNHILVSNNISTSKNQDTSYELSLTNSEQNFYDTVCTDENHNIYIQNEYQKCCQFSICTDEVFSACHRCSCLLCYEHFVNNYSTCENHLNFEADLTFTETLKFDFGQTDMQQTCEYANCTNPVLTTCFACSCLLCDIHFASVYYMQSCSDHKKNPASLTDFDITEIENVSNDSDATMVLSDTRDSSPSILMQNTVLEQQQDSYLAPEDFIVDGVAREEERSKPVRKNKHKEAKVLRHAGQEYISP